MQINDAQAVGIIVVTTDKGLCGSMNTNVLRAVTNRLRDWQAQKLQIQSVAIGNKGFGFLNRVGVPVVAHAVALGDTPHLDRLIGPIKLLLDQYAQGKLRAVYLCYTQFINTIKQEAVMERLLPLERECSVIIARSRCGSVVHLPVQRNLHRNGILAVTEVHDAALPPTLARDAVEAATAIAHKLDYVGVLCVEFFLLADGQLLVNEIAPRPHNSGHYSLDACNISQFELQVRCMTGMPLVQPRQHSPAIMLNLLGDLWFAQESPRQPAWETVLALPGCHLHLYGKTQAWHGRKMGHLTITGTTPSQARATALEAAALLGIAPF